MLLALFASSPASAFDPKDERTDVNIQLNMSWTTGRESNIQEKGSASVNISGEIELKKKTRYSLRYRSKNLRATYSYTNNYYYVGGGCTDCCPDGSLLTVEKGSGSTEPKRFVLDVTMGKLGNKIAFQKGCSEPVDGVYFFEAGVHIPTNFEYIQRGCTPSPWPLPGSWETKGRKFSFSGHRTLDAAGMHGAYTLTGGTFSPVSSFDSYVWDYCGKTIYSAMDGKRSDAPGLVPGTSRTSLNWQIGKTKPMVKIWRHYQNKGPEDVTDARPMKVPVIVGEKITLEAEILPPGTEVINGEWKIDEQKVIAGYEANDQKGRVLHLTKDDCQKKKIEFYYVEGGFSGTPQNITYSADSKKGKVEGRTMLTVFKPEAITKEKIPSKEITVGPMEDSCRLYLGKLTTPKPPKGKPGMLVSHDINMPAPFSNHSHRLQYVQRVKEEVLEHYNIDYSHRANEEWCLDTSYPYAKMKPTQNKVEMNDTPSQDLGQLTREVHIRDEFETYLMFLPSDNPQDENNIWIPLKVIEWRWGAGIKRTVDYDKNPPCNKNTFKSLHEHYPAPREKDSKKHPEWSCNVKDNERKWFRDEDKWTRLKASMAK